jgi:hypothetical protein
MKLQDDSHKEEDICGSCKKAFTEDESAIKCEGICRQWHHKDCSGITQGEFDIMKRNKCKLSWLCDICKPQLLKEKEQDDLLQKLNQKVDLTTQVLTKDMREMMENALKKTNDQTTEIRQTVNKEKQPSPEKTKDRNGKAIGHSKPGKENTGRGTRKEEHHRMKRRMSKIAVQTETSQTGMYKKMESNNRGWRSLLEEKRIRVNPGKTQQSLAP